MPIHILTINPTIDPTSDPTIDPTNDPAIDPMINPTTSNYKCNSCKQILKNLSLGSIT